MVIKNQKKVILITGVSSGLGNSILKDFSKLDYNLAVCSRKIDFLKKNYQNKKNIFFLKVDVRKEKEVKNFVKKTLNKFGRIDVLINNAGYAFNSKFEDIKTNLLDQLFKTNLYAPFYFIRECLPIMKKQNYGRIINISSGGSINCAKNYSAYSASKAALNTLAKSLKNEIENLDIKINTLSPGPIKTKMFPKNKLSPNLCLPTIKYLINLKKDGPSGDFFWFKKKINIIPNLKINWGKPKQKSK